MPIIGAEYQKKTREIMKIVFIKCMINKQDNWVDIYLTSFPLFPNFVILIE
jgi:hypothetical protein